MVNILDITYNAIHRYMNTLKYYGYSSYTNVDALLVLIMIEDIINGELSYFINQEDSNIIYKSLQCLMGNNCLIDFNIKDTNDKLLHPIQGTFNHRKTEDTLLRKTQKENLRIEA